MTVPSRQSPGSSGRTVGAELLRADSAFRVLGVPLDATERTVRRRFDEREAMRRVSGHAAETDGGAYRDAAAALQDPERRIALEFFDSWGDGGVQWPESLAHDEALANLRAWFRESPEFQFGWVTLAEGLRITIRTWGALADNRSLAQFVDSRVRALGLSPETWHAEGLVSDGLLNLTRRIPVIVAAHRDAGDSVTDGELQVAVAVADELAALRVEVARSSAVALLADYRNTVASQLKGTKTPRAVEHLTRTAFDVASALMETAPDAATALRDSVTQTCMEIAGELFGKEDLTGAEQVLGSLASLDLDTADQLEVERSLSSVRFAIHYRAAVANAEDGNLSAAAGRLRSAAGQATDPGVRDRLLDEARQLDAAAVRTGSQQSQNSRSSDQSNGWGKWVGWGIAVLVVLWIIGSLDGGSNGGQSSPRPSTAANSSSSSSASPGSSSAPGTSSSTQRTTSSSQWLDAVNRAVDAHNAVPDDDDPRFRSRALAASSAARAAQVASSSDTSSCGVATNRFMTTMTQYWSGLARATSGASVDVDLWNSTLDRYQDELFRRGDAARRAC